MSSNSQEETKKKISTDGQMLGRRIVRWADSMIDTVMLSLLLFFLILAVYALWDSNQIYQAGDSAQYESYKPDGEDGLSFEELKKINPEVFGWITIYGTHIDYPIAQAEDNDKYVNTSITGEYSLVGSIFLDYRNKNDFSDYNSILYGHHMEANAMFGEVGNFKEKEYFGEHKYGNLYFGGKDHGLEFFAFLEQDAYNFDFFIPAIEGEEKQQAYLRMLLDNAIYTRDIGLKPDDHIVLLYTCTSSTTNGRHVLAARITDQVFENNFEKEPAKIFGLDSQKIWALFNKLPLWAWIVIILILLLLMEIALRKALERSRKKKSKGEVEDENKTET